MHASDFITKRESLCKAHNRGVIDTPTFWREMHSLFVEAQVSKGVIDDCEKADMLAHIYANPQDRWL